MDGACSFMSGEIYNLSYSTSNEVDLHSTEAREQVLIDDSN